MDDFEQQQADLRQLMEIILENIIQFLFVRFGSWEYYAARKEWVVKRQNAYYLHKSEARLIYPNDEKGHPSVR